MDLENQDSWGEVRYLIQAINFEYISFALGSKFSPKSYMEKEIGILTG